MKLSDWVWGPWSAVSPEEWELSVLRGCEDVRTLNFGLVDLPKSVS